LERIAVAPAINRAVPVLPGFFLFIDQGAGQRNRHERPSDAPDDYVALRDVQRDDALLARYHLDADRIRAIRPVSILARRMGPAPAWKSSSDSGSGPDDREKLEKAKARHKSGFYQGVLNENCGRMRGCASSREGRDPGRNSR